MNKRKNRFNIIEKYIAGTSNKEQLDEAIELFETDAYNLRLRTALFERWEDETFEIAEKELEQSIDYNLMLGNIHHQINLNETRWFNTSTKRVRKLYDLATKIAAILFIPLLFISVWYFADPGIQTGKSAMVLLETPLGSKLMTTLPDGTEVWQNSGSTLKYENSFNTKVRAVYLEGEAYFKVKSDKFHPFYVHTNNTIVKVTGTEFNVSAYAEDNYTSVVLKTGILNFNGVINSKQQKVKLIPGDRVIYYNKEEKFIKDRPDIEKYTSWKDGHLIFRNDPLSAVVARLNRWYNADISIKNGELNNLPFTLTVRNETLPQVLEYLKLAAPIEVNSVQINKDRDENLIKTKYILKLKN